MEIINNKWTSKNLHINLMKDSKTILNKKDKKELSESTNVDGGMVYERH